MVKTRSRKKGKRGGPEKSTLSTIPREIRRAVDTGKVVFGSRQGIDFAEKEGKAKLLVVSSNCPKDLKETVENNCKKSQTAFFEFTGTSVELGSLCGKPFLVAVLSVLDEGNSDILKVIGKK
ncbi:50S ribosomal protein L30e [Candidatus Gugararchaeum adminiculabundum]|nr:50S ribosomal protein L30e [Candidatus Gugararchaeum adminiculabundum]